MNNKPICHPDTPESGQQLLSIAEKRAWLARIFRDTSGEYTDADKFKAMEADNRLVAMQANSQEKLDGSSSKPAVDTLKTCGNCAYYSPYTHRPDHGKCNKYAGLDWTYSTHEATHCRGYEPEQH